MKHFIYSIFFVAFFSTESIHAIPVSTYWSFPLQYSPSIDFRVLDPVPFNPLTLFTNDGYQGTTCTGVHVELVSTTVTDRSTIQIGSIIANDIGRFKIKGNNTDKYNFQVTDNLFADPKLSMRDIYSLLANVYVRVSNNANQQANFVFKWNLVFIETTYFDLDH
eukprot:PhF_6_TR25503/c1_g1_i7/m.35551